MKKKHFASFDNFVKLLFGLRLHFLWRYYRLFGAGIRKSLAKQIDAECSNALFLKRIDELFEIPEDISHLISPVEAAKIISEAENLSLNVFNLLGSGDTTLNPIDWHTDFKTGHRWPPGTFYKNYTQEGIATDSDVKVPHELSRCHHFLKLGLAYRLTGDEKFPRLGLQQMDDWIRENPLMLSINWGCTMDVAIRAVNWIWALKLFSGSPSITEESITRVKISLYEHGWFVYRNPEKSAVNNHNHYLADLSGQIHLGLIFSHLNEPKKWLNEGIKELFREMRMQILPTGMSYERSTNYNRLVLELILTPVLLMKHQGFEIPSDIWFRLVKMFEFIMCTLKPDGLTPIIGDQDDARLLPFGTEKNNDYRYLLSLGSVLYHRSDFKAHGDGYNIYCAILGGKDSKEKYEALVQVNSVLPSVAFPDSGFYVMRNDGSFLIFNASGKGRYPELPGGTHTHCDLLSFELYTLGKSFLVDPGSFVYTSDAAQRMLFRSTQMHNTLTIDAESQNILRKDVLWDFERNAIPEVLFWSATREKDIIVARHTGYQRLKQPVLHQRTICFDKQNNRWNIKDDLTGEGSHLFEWFFHFDTGIDFTIADKKIITQCNDGKNIAIRIEGDDNLTIRKEKSFVSKEYGRKEESVMLVVSLKSECPLELNIEITPIT